MAAKKVVEPMEVSVETAAEQPVAERAAAQEPVDLWEVRRKVYVLGEGFGENQRRHFAVNGIGMELRIGVEETVPEPIARRVDIYNATIRKRQAMYAKMRSEYARIANYL